jgi:preprotein translocase subunit SecE
MAKTSPIEFFQQVRQEVSRVTWPTRKETIVTTAMVFVMVFIAAAFFFVVDQAFSMGVRAVFGLGQ